MSEATAKRRDGERRAGRSGAAAVRIAAGLALTLVGAFAGCGEAERHLVVHMEEPMSVTVAASVGYTPEWVDQLGDEPADFPRGTMDVEVVDLRVMAQGRQVLTLKGRMTADVGTHHGVVYRIGVAPEWSLPLGAGPALMERLRSDLMGQGWRDEVRCPFHRTPPEVWARCATRATDEDRRRDYAGIAPRTPQMYLAHPAGAFVTVEVTCFKADDRGTYLVKPSYDFWVKPVCDDPGPVLNAKWRL